jgi:type IV pilus assembly protein PilW
MKSNLLWFTAMSPPKKHVQFGFTLLELLISVLIGSIVIAVVGSLFLANTNTFRAVDDTSRLQENGRFAMQTIGRVTRQAGFISADMFQVVSSKPTDAYALPSLNGIVGARFVAGTNGLGPNGSDTLALAFHPSPNGEIVDCTGAPRTRGLIPFTTAIAALPQPITNIFFVFQSSSGGGNSLWCREEVNGVETARFELITGVDSFQLLYAVDAPIPVAVPIPGGPTVTRNFAADYVTSANNLTSDAFNNVLGIQVALVLRGAERSTLDVAQVSNKLLPFGASYTGANSDPDGAAYTIQAADSLRTFRVITSTINLRNRGA